MASGLSDFIIGSVAGIGATHFVHPMDLVKVRLQTSGVGGSQKYKGSYDVMKTIVKTEGPIGLYSGLGASLLRQITYTPTRFVIFNYFNHRYKKMYGELTFSSRLLSGSIAGAIGAIIGTPTDVVLIRMAADGSLPLEQRRNYKNAINALIRISREEGLRALWCGGLPTVVRGTVGNSIGFAAYSQTKSTLIHEYGMPDDFVCHFFGSMMSGAGTTVFTMPLDICKTRIQNMKTIDGKPEYTGMADVFVKTLRREGIMSLWKGSIMFYARQGPFTMLVFIFYEELSTLYNKHILGVEKSSDL